MKTKILSLLMAIIMVIGLMPVSVWAVDNTFNISEGDITIAAGTTAGTLKVTYGSSDPQSTTDNIDSNQTITITGDPTSNKITVNSDIPDTINISLDNVSINIDTACAFSIGSGSIVNLTLLGTNTLTSAGIYTQGLVCLKVQSLI